MSLFPVSLNSFLAGPTVISPQNSGEWPSFGFPKSQNLSFQCAVLCLEYGNPFNFFFYEEISMLGLSRQESSNVVIETQMN